MDRDIMPMPVTQDDAYKPKHTDGGLAAAKAEARRAAFLEAAETLQQEAGVQEHARKGGSLKTADSALFQMAAVLRAKAEERQEVTV